MFGTSSAKPLVRPTLTLPAEAAAWVREAYAKARVILEYGSGGSTVLASEMPGKQVFAVESDANWARMLRTYLDQAGTASPVTLHHADIGPTAKWGYPQSDKHWREFHRYPLSVWDREDFRHPDLILIDGRFRPACLLTAMMRAEHPISVLFDDYKTRKKYWVVEEFIQPVEARGRMVRFEVTPSTLPPRHLGRVLALFTEPF